jgi:hypothetical protein
MKLLIDSFWRAVAYCLHPKVIGLSLLPLLLAGVSSALLGWFYWEGAVAAVRATMESWLIVGALLQWIESIGGGAFRAVIAPMIVVALAVPVIVVLSLLLVALLMTPAMVDLVAARRFPTLERKHGAGFAASALWSIGCTAVALVALALSLPLWFTPLVLLLPPLIWGWLTYRVLSFDVLAAHASASERRSLMREHRAALIGMGVIAGYLGAAPSLLWAVSAATLIFAPLLIVLAVWVYTLVFAFAALWFAHYALAALQAQRARATDIAPASPSPPIGAPQALEPPASAKPGPELLPPP